jgi:hypothetical protein
MFVTNCPGFQNRDGQPTFKFRKQQDEMYTYRMIPDLKYVWVVYFSEHYTKPKTATDSNGLLFGYSSTKPNILGIIR